METEHLGERTTKELEFVYRNPVSSSKYYATMGTKNVSGKIPPGKK